MRVPLCFVLMPYGKKPDGAGGVLDFDEIYTTIIKEAITAAELEPIRADEEEMGGVIHKAMFERLLLCPYAVADVTAANCNVLYELGVRHALRPFSTVLIQAKGSRLPFDLNAVRVLPYDRVDQTASRESIVKALRAARNSEHDSPVFTFIEGLSPPEIAHEKTDAFRDRVEYSKSLKARLAEARRKGADEVATVEASLGRIEDVEAGVLIDLFLSYRAVRAWRKMVDLAARMPRPLASTVMVGEQLALALNRDGRSEDAARVLQDLIVEHGPSSETYGILGRVCKDRWDAAKKDATREVEAAGLLDNAIDAYVKGFEADWRDHYPGVNAVTLMELREPIDERQSALVPVVRYAVERKIAAGRADYWDHATLLELALLARDERTSRTQLQKALASVRERWEPETTANNLRLIREARSQRGETLEWANAAETALRARAAR